jgi:hypothetical protein
MTELITVPTFVFPQGKLGDENYEAPIHVDFYNGTIILRQDGEYEKQEEIKLSYDQIDTLFKAIKKHRPDAEAMLKR